MSSSFVEERESTDVKYNLTSQKDLFKLGFEILDGWT